MVVHQETDHWARSDRQRAPVRNHDPIEVTAWYKRSKLNCMAIVLAAAGALAFAADWDPAAAAKYLDSRQEKWSAWPTAALKGGPCLSCHTGITYLLARPVLRGALGETAPARSTL